MVLCEPPGGCLYIQLRRTEAPRNTRRYVWRLLLTKFLSSASPYQRARNEREKREQDSYQARLRISEFGVHLSESCFLILGIVWCFPVKQSFNVGLDRSTLTPRYENPRSPPSTHMLRQ